MLIFLVKVISSIMWLKVPKNIGTFKWRMKISLNLLATFENARRSQILC
jgi:hypothetical protein